MLQVGGNTLEEVKTFKHLGVEFTSPVTEGGYDTSQKGAQL